MRCFTDKTSRAALTLVLVVFMVYLASYGTYNTALHTQMLALSLVTEQTAGQLQGNNSPPRETTPTPTPALKPYTVIHNKVQYMDAWPIASKKDVGLEPSAGAALLHLNYSHYEPEELPYLESRVEEMVARAMQVKHECLNAPTPRHGFPNLVWDQGHRVVWCPNYKVASTTWMINFLKLANFNDDNPDIPADLPPERREELKYSPKYGAKHYEVFKLYPTPNSFQDKMTALQKSARVIIVRHPFTRILSAYRDKMTKLNPLPAKFKFRKLQKDIIQRYRPDNSPETSPFPTFPEFVQHVVDYTAAFTTADEWRKNVKCWVPFWAQCNVCTLDYNVIMKLETMPQDERFLITLSHMMELKKTQGEWRHLNNVSSQQAAPDFYQKLTTRQMLDLHQRYKFDFELFNYTLDAYLPLATDAPAHPPS